MHTLSHLFHILFAGIALGGLLYGGLVVAPAMKGLDDGERAALSERIAGRFRPLALGALALLLITGSINLLRALEQGVDSTYHMIFGIKFLLALHVFGMLFLATTPPAGDPEKEAKRPRLMIGGAISALVVFVLGVYLESLRT